MSDRETSATVAPSWADTELARVSAQAPGWRIWYIHMASSVGRGFSWSAMPEGAVTAAIISDGPDGLLGKIHDCESWLPDTIEQARERLERTPENWTSERLALTTQLESLLREQRNRATIL